MAKRARIERSKRAPRRPADSSGDEPVPVVTARTKRVVSDANKFLDRLDKVEARR